MRRISKRFGPVAVSIAESIRKRILDGEYQAGAYLDPEQKIAESLDVSRGSVRQAINLLVETGELVRRPNFRPTIANRARHMEARTGLDIYVWVSYPIAESTSLTFVKGVSRGLAGTPYRMTVREPTRFFGEYVKLDERQFLIDLLGYDNVIGVILQRDFFADNGDVMEKLVRAGIHTIFVDTPPPAGIAADHIGTANASAARLCVEHLTGLGHQRILCVLDNDVPIPMQERTRGYYRAMAQSGLSDLAQYVVASELEDAPVHLQAAGPFAEVLAGDSPYWRLSERLVSFILKMENRPTALFVGCDILAYGVCALLEGAGLSVPNDISVVGFDWLGRFHPSFDHLTTASQDFEGFGWHAAEQLLDRISGDSLPTPCHILLPAPLVIRQTTARNPVSRSDI